MSTHHNPPHSKSDDITRVVVGVEVKWHISGSLPLMLMLNGLNPDDTSTVLKELTIPRITKPFWPVVINSAPEGYKRFDFPRAL